MIDCYRNTDQDNKDFPVSQPYRNQSRQNEVDMVMEAEVAVGATKKDNKQLQRKKDELCWSTMGSIADGTRRRIGVRRKERSLSWIWYSF